MVGAGALCVCCLYLVSVHIMSPKGSICINDHYKGLLRIPGCINIVYVKLNGNFKLNTVQKMTIVCPHESQTNISHACWKPTSIYVLLSYLSSFTQRTVT